MPLILRWLLLVATSARLAAAAPPVLKPQRIALASGAPFSLSVAKGWSLAPAAEGLGRCRFMAMSPDGRLFVPDMVNLSDNHEGTLWILEDFDPATRRYRRTTKYLTGLRNPNSVAFWTDAGGTTWLYLALTEHLLRYRYHAGDVKPSGEPEVLATWPAYGLSYKYGGWHLTRTVVVTPAGRLFVSVGSSCNACEEKESVRATIQVMDADGSRARTFARGLRNAVGLKLVGDHLYCTGMGADHLGNDRPDETLQEVLDGMDYGWPWAYQHGGAVVLDPAHPANASQKAADVPRALATFPAHAAPLGLEHVAACADSQLQGRWLVALHGSTNKAIRHGYAIVSVEPGRRAVPFVTGFLVSGKVLGRPCDILQIDASSFLFTDDKAGVVYHLRWVSP